LFGVQQSLVEPLRTRREIDLMVNGDRLERVIRARGCGYAQVIFRFLILSDCAEATDKPLSAITVIAIYLLLIVSSRYLPAFAQVIPLRPNDKKISSCYRNRASLLSSSATQISTSSRWRHCFRLSSSRLRMVR
jgi:hypothetical protein